MRWISTRRLWPKPLPAAALLLLLTSLGCVTTEELAADGASPSRVLTYRTPMRTTYAVNYSALSNNIDAASELKNAQNVLERSDVAHATLLKRGSAPLLQTDAVAGPGAYAAMDLISGSRLGEVATLIALKANTPITVVDLYRARANVTSDDYKAIADPKRPVIMFKYPAFLAFPNDPNGFKNMAMVIRDANVVDVDATRTLQVRRLPENPDLERTKIPLFPHALDWLSAYTEGCSDPRSHLLDLLAVFEDIHEPWHPLETNDLNRLFVGLVLYEKKMMMLAGMTAKDVRGYLDTSGSSEIARIVKKYVHTKLRHAPQGDSPLPPEALAGLKSVGLLDQAAAPAGVEDLARLVLDRVRIKMPDAAEALTRHLEYANLLRTGNLANGMTVWEPRAPLQGEALKAALNEGEREGHRINIYLPAAPALAPAPARIPANGEGGGSEGNGSGGGSSGEAGGDAPEGGKASAPAQTTTE